MYGKHIHYNTVRSERGMYSSQTQKKFFFYYLAQELSNVESIDEGSRWCALTDLFSRLFICAASVAIEVVGHCFCSDRPFRIVCNAVRRVKGRIGRPPTVSLPKSLAKWQLDAVPLSTARNVTYKHITHKNLPLQKSSCPTWTLSLV